MKGYTNKISIENYLLKNIAEEFNDQVESWIEQVEKYIEKFTGRVFVADSVASEKVYDGDNTSKLLIDDAVDITKVEVDDVEITEYYEYPSNKLPITSLRLDSDVFARGMQNVSVTAKWGYSVAVPDDIAYAAMVLVAGIVNNSEGEGDVKSEKIGNYQVSYSEKGLDDFNQAMNILKSYKKFAV